MSCLLQAPETPLQEAERLLNGFFTDCDDNEDGFLTKHEMHQRAPEITDHFSELDVDKDRQISRTELMAWLHNRAESDPEFVVPFNAALKKEGY